MELKDILLLTVEELRANTSELGLDATGTKTDLQERLITYFNDRRDVGGSQKLDGTSSMIRDESIASSNFTLRDIEDSVTKFSGEDNHDVERWIQEFEDCAYVLGWNQQQHFIYARQLLTGAAKIFIRSQSNVRDWGTLRAILRKEFGAKPSAVSIHRKLKARRKRNDESLRQYLYSIMEIASPISLDDASIIEYFVEGIPGSVTSKSILYQAKDLEDLKEKLSVFEKIAATEKSLNSNMDSGRPRTSYNLPHSRNTNIRFLKCGEEGHLAKNCKSVSTKCFKCNRTGHKSYECTTPKRDSTNANLKLGVHTLTEGAYSVPKRVFKDITVFGKVISAIIDTGSDISILRYDTLLSLSDATLEPEKKTLQGIGGRNITTLGCIETRAKLDAVELKMVFHIVREGDVVYAAVIGNDILDKVDLIIDSTGAKFRNKYKEVNIFERYNEEDLDNDESDESFHPVEEFNINPRSALEANPITELKDEFEAIVYSATGV